MTGTRVRASKWRGCIVCVAVVAALLSPDTGSASYPGTNGKVAFRRNPGSTLWTANADGSGEQQVAGIQNAWFPSFSPDGKLIAYQAGEGFANGSIAVVGLDGGGPETIVPEDSAGNIVGGPTWSPDGTKLAFSVYNARPEASVYEIRVVDAATGAAVATLRSPEVVETGDGRTLRGDLSSPAWSPTDGQTLAVVHEHAVGFTDIATITLDGTLTDVTDEPTGAHEFLDWSPDGTRIAFTQRTDDGSGDSVVKTIGRSGGGAVQITADAGRYGDLAFSPDGTKLLLSRGGNLYTISTQATTGTPAILPGAGGDRNEPTWGSFKKSLMLSGTVTTSNCSDTACVPAPLAGATVTATGPSTGEAVTGEDGSYVIELEEPGAYTVTPSMPDQPGRGFRPGSRSVYLKADKGGVDFMTCSAGASSDGGERVLAAEEDLCYSILVEDLNGSGQGGGGLEEFVRMDVPPVNLSLRGVGWNPAGGPIDLSWEGKRIKRFPAASSFTGKIVAEYWPERTSYGSGRAICGGHVSGRQGGVTRNVTVLAGAGAIVLFADRDPVFRAGNFICLGEFQSVLKKTPGTVISSDLRGEKLVVSRDGRNTPPLIVGGTLCVTLDDGRGHVNVRRVDGRLDVSGRKSGRCR